MYVHVWWNQIHIRSETSNVLDFKRINIWLKDDVDLQQCHLWANNEFQSLTTIDVFYLCDIKIRKCSWFMISCFLFYFENVTSCVTFRFSVPSFTCPLPSSLQLHLIPCSCVFVLLRSLSGPSVVSCDAILSCLVLSSLSLFSLVCICLLSLWFIFVFSRSLGFYVIQFCLLTFRSSVLPPVCIEVLTLFTKI